MPEVPLNKVFGRLKDWGDLLSAPWIAVLARVIVGGVFIVAGFSKLLLPHAEVVALITQYQVLPAVLVPTIAAGLPWLEVVSGTALLIGFYTTVAALVVGVQLVGFSGLMLVLLASGTVIEDCGCFGNLGLHETPLQVLIRDVVMLTILVPVLTRRRDVLALDTE